MARKILKTFEKVNEPKLPGTRPADIKRYLKELLDLRSDLVLVDRLLLIRPVRHLLRGALLDRTSDKYSFRIWRCASPLFADVGSDGDGDYLDYTASRVWTSYFQPRLMDALAEDIFDNVGKITTLADFAAGSTAAGRSITARVRALVLAGEPERAADFVRTVEQGYLNPYWQGWPAQQRALLDRDVASVCAEFHAREEKIAKALKLGEIWEPMPFPAELPAAGRASAPADPLFVPTPWVPRPPWLLQDVPDLPGEIRFGRDTVHRNGRVILLVPLTSREAEERHQTPARYVLATRLSAGVLVVLTREPSWEPDEPLRSWERVPRSAPDRVEIVVELYSSSRYARAESKEI